MSTIKQKNKRQEKWWKKKYIQQCQQSVNWKEILAKLSTIGYKGKRLTRWCSGCWINCCVTHIHKSCSNGNAIAEIKI